MLVQVLANEMFDSPPVFAWVLPVFVRLKPGMEETFSPRHGQLAANLQQWKHEQQRIVGEALLNKRPHPELPHGFLQNHPCCRGSISIRRPTWRSCSLRKQRTRSARFSSTRVSLHSRMEGGNSTVVNGLPTTEEPLSQTTFCRTFLSCRTKNVLVRIFQHWSR